MKSAILDHDYLIMPITEYWVDNALQVTQREAPEIQEKARDQSSSKSCFNERSWRITSSRFCDIYLATPRRNTTKLCQCLVQTPAASFRNEAISHGKVYEPSVVLKQTLALHTCVQGMDRQHLQIARLYL
uniref:Uncharacterized protein n=1 Tax=Magallana gigas TaxID=29159 RepID=A0A8W8I6H9_MAGGI